MKARQEHAALAARVSPQVRWWIWCADPLMIAVFATIPFVLALFVSDVGQREYSDALATVARWGDGSPVRFFEAAGIIATVLVALAAATNFGKTSASLCERTMTFILVGVVVAVLTILGLVAASIVAASVHPQQWPDTLTVIAIGWLCLLVSHVVFGEASRVEKSRTARAHWKQVKARAAEHGIRRGVADRMHARIARELFFWMLPFGVWIATGVVIAGVGGLFVAGSPVFAIIVMLYYPIVLAAFGWRATADLSRHRAARYAVRGGVLVGVLAMVSVFALTMLAWPDLVPLAIALVAFTLVFLVTVYVAPHDHKVPLLRAIEVATTVASLERSHARRKALRAAS